MFYIRDWFLISLTRLRLFHRLNTCPFQGSRTIRTEEAVLISLAQLSQPLALSARDKETEQFKEESNTELNDDSASDESSSSEGQSDSSDTEGEE